MKLPERFLKASPDDPCYKCDKVRSTCRFCGGCRDCCDCPICPFCQGAEPDGSSPDFIKEVGLECTCEPCAGCFSHIDRDLGNYVPNPAGGRDLCYCDKCYAKLEKKEAAGK